MCVYTRSPVGAAAVQPAVCVPSCASSPTPCGQPIAKLGSIGSGSERGKCRFSESAKQLFARRRSRGGRAAGSLAEPATPVSLSLRPYPKAKPREDGPNHSSCRGASRAGLRRRLLRCCCCCCCRGAGCPSHRVRQGVHAAAGRRHLALVPHCEPLRCLHSPCDQPAPCARHLLSKLIVCACGCFSGASRLGFRSSSCTVVRATAWQTIRTSTSAFSTPACSSWWRLTSAAPASHSHQ
jgi:hypothetical protein